MAMYDRTKSLVNYLSAIKFRNDTIEFNHTTLYTAPFVLML